MANWIPKFTYTHPIDGATTITLSLPPREDPDNERNFSIGKETRSSSGASQYQKNYQDKQFTLNLIFLTLAEKTALQKLFDDYASYGYSFNYYPSSDEATFYTVIWPGDRKEFSPKKVVVSGADFIYDLKIPLRVEN